MTSPEKPSSRTTSSLSARDAAFVRPVRVADLPQSGEDFAARGGEAARAALAARLDVSRVKRLSLEARLRPEEDGWRVSGRVRARVTQPCVVTLEPVDQILDEPFSRLFLPDAPDPEEVALDPDEEEDPPEPLGRFIDIADIAAEALALALDPYPRAEGAALKDAPEPSDGQDGAGDAARRPFAALSGLREKMERSDNRKDED